MSDTAAVLGVLGFVSRCLKDPTCLETETQRWLISPHVAYPSIHRASSVQDFVYPQYCPRGAVLFLRVLCLGGV